MINNGLKTIAFMAGLTVYTIAVIKITTKVNELNAESERKHTTDTISAKQDIFDHLYKEANKYMPQLDVDITDMEKFESDCAELQSYVNELFTYLNQAYNAITVEEVDRAIVSTKDLIKRLKMIQK